MSSILKVDQLKDSGGNAIITSNGSGTFTSSLPNTGITMADQFRLTTNLQTTSSATDISANLERVDDTSFAKIGTGMTESSGVFSFPQTGLYLVTSFFVVQANSTSTRFIENMIDVTLDNSSFTRIAETYSGVNNVTSSTYTNVAASAFVNVTNISNVKVKFLQSSASTTSIFIRGKTSKNATTFTFIRLGDSQ
jgi:hypothetical protein